MNLLFQRTSLWLRIAGPFFLFVVAGSLALAGWLQAAARWESEAVFTALASTNADFVRTAHLPESEQMMGYLGRLLNMRAFLVRDGGEITPIPEGKLGAVRGALGSVRPEDGIVRLGGKFEAIAASVEGNLRLILVRPAEPALAFVSRRETALVLGAFWFLSVALAWAITRGVVRPLRMLARRLPTIEHDAEGTLPGAERSDEIGQLARAYLAARSQLAEERERREKAERHALLGRMATGLAHEIHNPLSAIRLHAQLLESASALETKAALREAVPIFLDESARIEGLVNQWMFLARPAPPQTAVIRLEELIERAVRNLRATAEHAGVEIANRATSKHLVLADARRLLQAITNVILNATQAMKRSGVLTISIVAEGAEARLLFSDTGPGFSAEALARHRELFFSQKEGGMGIGLSVTAEIVEAHGGRLEVANSAGGGASVALILPLAPSASGNDPCEESREASPVQPACLHP